MKSDDPTPLAPFQPHYDDQDHEAHSERSSPVAAIKTRISRQFARFGWWSAAVPVALILGILGAGAFRASRSSAPSSGSANDVATTVPLVGTVLAGHQSLVAPVASVLNLILVDGSVILPDARLDTSDLNANGLPDASYALLVVIRPSDGAVTADLLKSSQLRAQLVESISELFSDSEFRGVVFDFGDLEPDQTAAFNALIHSVGASLGDEWLLGVWVPTPQYADSKWDTPGYDWRRLGGAVDLLVVVPPSGPDQYVDGGLADLMLSWAATRVDAAKLFPAFSALSIDQWSEEFNPIPYEYALNPLGEVGLNPESLSGKPHPEPGQELVFELNGTAVSIDQDADSELFYYEVYGGDGVHRVWLMTPAALRARLDWIASRQVGGIILLDLLDERTTGGLLTVLQEFKLGQPSTLTSDLQLEWTIREADGPVIIERATALGDSITWTPEDEGDYLVSASLSGFGFSDRGALPLIVGGETIGIAPAQEGIVAGAPDSPPPTAPSGNEGLRAPIPDDMPPPVYPPGAVGNFELGGQVNHVIEHPGYMRQAGMTWVKFQLAWAEDLDSSVAWELIERGRKENFKVLLSITGREKYPTDIDVAKFLDFLEGVAYYGADAIEVWNEPNIDYEWPRGRIDGGRYVRELLAPAYNAIKSVNPNVMVISAAPAPTGAYYGEGGCSKQGFGCDDWLYLQQMAEAGAANYMDCVGAHYNSGATSPTQSTGHPADPGYGHYSWYFPGMLQLYGGTFGHRVCFTELGYLSGDGLGPVPDRFDWARDTSVAEQAQWLAEAAQLSRDSGLVRLLIVWNVDFTYWGDDPMAGYAIVRPDGRCPACSTLGDVMN